MGDWKKKKKKRKIEAILEIIEKRLANAAEYLAQDVNVEGTSFLHFGDWRGQSGHPSWMRNYMIPTTMKARARKEKALENIVSKAKEKALRRRKQYGKVALVRFLEIQPAEGRLGDQFVLS